MSAHHNINRAQFTDEQLLHEDKVYALRQGALPLAGVASVVAGFTLPPPVSVPVIAGLMAAGWKARGSIDMHHAHEDAFVERFGREP